MILVIFMVSRFSGCRCLVWCDSSCCWLLMGFFLFSSTWVRYGWSICSCHSRVQLSRAAGCSNFTRFRFFVPSFPTLMWCSLLSSTIPSYSLPPSLSLYKRAPKARGSSLFWLPYLMDKLIDWRTDVLISTNQLITLWILLISFDHITEP